MLKTYQEYLFNPDILAKKPRLEPFNPDSAGLERKFSDPEDNPCHFSPKDPRSLPLKPNLKLVNISDFDIIHGRGTRLT